MGGIAIPTDEEIYQMCLKWIKEDADKAFKRLENYLRIVQNKDNVIDLNKYRNKTHGGFINES